MRMSMLLAAAAALFVNGNHTSGGEKHATGKLVQINLSVYEGDPLGSREAGTIKCLAQPLIITKENSVCKFVSGGEKVMIPQMATGSNGGMVDGFTYWPTGLTCSFTPTFVEDGKVRMDVTLEITTPGEKSAERIQIHSQSTWTITTVKLGEVVKLRFGKAESDKQHWVEMSVEAAK